MNDLYLEHHGIKGQKWGVRRYQNEDGTYTEAGKTRRASSDKREIRKAYRKYYKLQKDNTKELNTYLTKNYTKSLDRNINTYNDVRSKLDDLDKLDGLSMPQMLKYRNLRNAEARTSEAIKKAVINLKSDWQVSKYVDTGKKILEDMSAELNSYGKETQYKRLKQRKILKVDQKSALNKYNTVKDRYKGV